MNDTLNSTKMVKKQKNRFECVTPILNVKDLRLSLDYYVSKLGFKKDWDWGDPPDFASVTRDGVTIFLCQGAQGHVGAWMSIFIDDVDALHKEYQQNGVTIRQAPTNFPWGTREMNVEDPDGHRLRMTCDATGPSDGTALMEN